MIDKSAVTPQVIRRAQRGDAAAMTIIYQAYVGMIYRYIAYRIGSDADAEDLTAEVFVRMVKGLASYRPTGAPFEAWLYRIAAARVADFYRRRKLRSHLELTEHMVSDSPLPEDHMVARQESMELRNALRQLSDDEQTVLIMRFVELKSHQEVAVLLGKSATAVKSIQHRALVRLVSLLGSAQKVRHYLRGRND